jgi:hypothetical protein
MKSTKLKKHNKIIMIVVLILSLLIVGAYSFLTRNRFYFLPQEISCVLKGNKWQVLKGNYPIPIGVCYIEITSDKNKQCSSSKDCQSKYCYITSGNEKNADGKYIGKCEYMISEYMFHTKIRPETECGNALIEDGIIVDDKRNCVY